MAPTKKDNDKAEKEAKLTPDQSAALVVDYLRKQNRPYSATDISANLKNRVTKAAAAKLLKDMHERGEIEGRAAGKQIVYHALQDVHDEATTEQLNEMDAEIARLREEINALKAEEKRLRLALRESAGQVSISEIRDAVTAVETEVSEMSARLDRLSRGDLQPVDLETCRAVEESLRILTRRAANRTKISRELWKEIEAVIEKDKVEETKEELGLEV